MGDGTKENPLTREDVLRLIEENGGTAEGLDLSEKVFEAGIDLSGLELNEIILDGTKLDEANLERAILAGANLQRASLCGANLQGVKCGGIDLRNAILIGTDLRGANIAGADMRGALFLSVEFNRDTDFINVNWGSKHCVPRWIECTAERTYRELKNWHNEAGMYNVAGDFFYREMTAKRNLFWLGTSEERPIIWLPDRGFLLAGKSRSEYLREHLRPFKPKELLKAIFPKKPFHWAWSKFLSLSCGYGERPLRVIGLAASILLVSTLIYFIIGSVWEWQAFWNSLYFSAVSFTALGYGSWLQVTNDWIRGIGAFESFIGVFMIALFLITFVRKMTR